MRYSTSYSMSYDVMGTTLASVCVCMCVCMYVNFLLIKPRDLSELLIIPSICRSSRQSGQLRGICDLY